MAKGKSWGPTQEQYVNSDLAKERCLTARLTGTVNRVCGLLGLEAGQDSLDDWCENEDKRRREERERQKGAA
jgi:hypothetical protein